MLENINAPSTILDVVVEIIVRSTELAFPKLRSGAQGHFPRQQVHGYSCKSHVVSSVYTDCYHRKVIS